MLCTVKASNCAYVCTCVGVRLILYMMTLIPVDCCNSCMNTPIVNLQRKQLPGLAAGYAAYTTSSRDIH